VIKYISTANSSGEVSSALGQDGTNDCERCVMIGMRTDELVTPCLVLDLDAAEANFSEAVSILADRGKVLRPHFKVHRSPLLARRQFQLGAKGFTCARLDEAEALLDYGLDDILVANTFSGRPKCRYAASLAGRGRVIFVLDNLDTARMLAEEARVAKTSCGYLIDIDLGMNRSGMTSTEGALEFYQALRGLENMQFEGLMGYEGHLVLMPNGEEKEAKLRAALSKLSEAVRAFRREGIDVPVVSAGGTGSFQVTGEIPEVTELQMGTFMFMDDVFREVGVAFRNAVGVLTRVVYRQENRIVLDCGMKGMHPGHGVSARDDPHLAVEKLSAEHAKCRLAEGARDYRVGDVVPLNISYADGTLNLYSRMLGVRDGRVEAIFARMAGL